MEQNKSITWEVAPRFRPSATRLDVSVTIPQTSIRVLPYALVGGATGVTLSCAVDRERSQVVPLCEVRAGAREVVLTVRTVTGAASTAGTYNATVVLTDTSTPAGVASLVELFLRVIVDPQVRRCGASPPPRVLKKRGTLHASRDRLAHAHISAG
jgi:hypothetical protein